MAHLRFSLPALLSALLAGITSAAETTDQTLRAVQFVDALDGWAAGDGGCILRSMDGGFHWQAQRSGTPAALRSVSFVDSSTGWAVGTLEYPSRSVGVVLTTEDGGASWKPLCSDSLPGLNFVRFWDAANGVAAGECSPWCPTGIHVSADGGRTWKAVAGPSGSAVIAADFADPQNGIVTRADGRIDVLRAGAVRAAEYDSLHGRRTLAVRLREDAAAAVGEGNLLLTSSHSAGQRWGFSNNGWEGELADDCQWQALANVGPHLWAAGRPGTAILHSADFGRTWDVQKTTSPLPLHAVQFTDENLGWAVGEMGTVLKTIDGGKTWKAIGAKKRPAALFLADGSNAPCYDAAVALGLDERYRLTALPDGDRLHEAKEAAAWHSAGGSGWEQRDRPISRTIREAVLALRVWRPDIVVHPAATGDEMIWKLAIEKAADPDQYRDQIASLGLLPWAVAKQFRRDDTTRIGGVRLNVGDFREALGGSAKDAAAEARSLVRIEEDAAEARGFTLIGSRIPNAGYANLMDGIADSPETRMAGRPRDRTSDAELRKTLVERKVFQALIREETPLGNADSIIVQFKPLLAKVPPEVAARTCYSLANQMIAHGKWMQAREVFEVLVNDYPRDPLAAEALRWLVGFHASSECRRRMERRQILARGEAVNPNARALTPEGSQFTTRQETAYIVSPAEVRRWHAGALEQEKRLAAFGPALANDIPLQVGLAAARRQVGEPDAAADSLQKLFAALPREADEAKAKVGRDPWRDILLGELWLANRGSGVGNPRPTAVARKTSARPKLDGKFDDECWAEIPPIPLKSADGVSAKGSNARIRFDDRFLYIAVECPHGHGKPIPKIEARTRDMDLTGQDRIAIVLDLDRDYQTFFRFEVDARGAVRDDCWGDSTWNPQWYVAVDGDAVAWRAELAIPIDELTADKTLAGKVWAFNIVRTKPNGEREAFSLRAAKPPEPCDMGLLQFWDQPKK